MRRRRDRERSLVTRAVAKRRPKRMVSRAADMHFVLMDTGSEIKPRTLRKDVALNEHRVGQRRFTENSLKKLKHARMGAQAV